MNRQTDVDATPCFLPIFLLFGLGNGARTGVGPRPYGPFGIYGRPGGRVAPGWGVRALGAGANVPVQRNVRMGNPSFVSPYVLGPQARYGNVRKGPIMF